MARNSPNAAERYTDEELEKVESGEVTGSQAIKEKKDINKILGSIRELLGDTAGKKDNKRGETQQNKSQLSEWERAKFQRELENVERTRDPKEVERLQREVTQTISDTQNITRSFFAEIEKNQNLFGIQSNPLKKDPKNEAMLEERKKQFLDQTIEGKKLRLEQLKDEIKELQKMRGDLVKLVGESKVHVESMDALGEKKEKGSYLDQIRKNMEEFKELMKEQKKKGLKDTEKSEILFRESSLDEQGKTLKKMREELTTKNSKESFAAQQKTYEAFNPKRQKEFAGQWEKCKNDEQREKVLEKMRESIRGEHKSLWNSCKFYTTEEKTNAWKSLQGKDFNVAFVEQLLQDFEKWLAPIKADAKIFEDAPLGVKMHYANFYEVGHTEKAEYAKEIKDHAKLIEKWDKETESCKKKKLICDISAEKYKKEFAQASLQDKRKYTSGANVLNDPRRTQTLREFQNLPRDVQKKHKDFYDLSLRERNGLVQKLKQELNEKASIKKGMHAEVETMVKTKLLAKKSSVAYHDWIQKMDDLDQLRKMSEKSDLKDPRREHALEAFKELPADVQKKNQDFYEKDLTGRIEMIAALNPEKKGEFEKKLKGLEKGEKEISKLENKRSLVDLLKLAERFENEGNLEAEEAIRKVITEKDAVDHKNQKRLQEIQMLKTQSPDVLAFLQAAKNNPEMRKKLEMLQIEMTYYDIIHQNETRQKNVRGIKARTQEQGNEELTNLQKQVMEHSKGKKTLDRKTGKAEDVKRLDLKKLHNEDPELQRQRLMFTQGQEKAKVIQDEHEGDKFTMMDDRQEGKELTAEELTRKVEEDATKMADNVIQLDKNRGKRKMSAEKRKATQEAVKQQLKNRTYLKNAA